MKIAPGLYLKSRKLRLAPWQGLNWGEMVAALQLPPPSLPTPRRKPLPHCCGAACVSLMQYSFIVEVNTMNREVQALSALMVAVSLLVQGTVRIDFATFSLVSN